MKIFHSSAHSQIVLSIAMFDQLSNLGTQLKSFKFCYLTLIILLYTSVWLQEKLDWQVDIVYFVYWINKRMEYLAGWRKVICSAASGCFELVWRCCRVTLSATTGDSTACVTSAWPIYIFPTSNTGSRKHYLWKNYWLKNRLLFYNWEFSRDFE